MNSEIIEESDNTETNIKNNSNAQELQIPQPEKAIFSNVQKSRVFGICHTGRRLVTIQKLLPTKCVITPVVWLKYFID